MRWRIEMAGTASGCSVMGNCWLVSVYTDSKVHGANIGPIWGWQVPGGPHVGPMILAIWVLFHIFIHTILYTTWGWVGLWGFLWWAPSAKRKDHHGASSGWSSVWHCSNTGLSSTQCEQIPIILGVWPFWLTPFSFRSITFWRACG